jgi:hypothetical protein
MYHCYKCNAPVFDGAASYSGPTCKCFSFRASNITGAAPAPWVPYREQELVPSAELAALRKDAERYRWLRDVGDETWVPMGKRPSVNFTHEIDQAIDAAIAKAAAVGAA